MARKVQSDEEVAILSSVRSRFPAFLDGVTFGAKDTETPDFIGEDATNRRVGLELTRWLNGHQTRAAINRERTRDTLLNIIDSGQYPRPKNIRSCVVMPSWQRPVEKA